MMYGPTSIKFAYGESNYIAVRSNSKKMIYASCDKVKNAGSHTSISPIHAHGKYRDNFIFLTQTEA